MEKNSWWIFALLMMFANMLMAIYNFTEVARLEVGVIGHDQVIRAIIKKLGWGG